MNAADKIPAIRSKAELLLGRSLEELKQSHVQFRQAIREQQKD